MDRYIGLDAHASSCTVAVIDPIGKRLQSRSLARSHNRYFLPSGSPFVH